jgi:hypothetical protein
MALSGRLNDRSQTVAQRPGNLRPIHRNDLAQRIGVERLFGCTEDRVLGQHLAELPHATLEQATGHFIRRHLPGAGTRYTPAGRALDGR